MRGDEWWSKAELEQRKAGTHFALRLGFDLREKVGICMCRAASTRSPMWRSGMGMELHDAATGGQRLAGDEQPLSSPSLTRGGWRGRCRRTSRPW